MSIEGNKFCDFCGEPILRDDLAPVRIPKDGHFEQCHFHNRHGQDCLSQQLAILESELTAA